jgi:hypothetical protein
MRQSEDTFDKEEGDQHQGCVTAPSVHAEQQDADGKHTAAVAMTTRRQNVCKGTWWRAYGRWQEQPTDINVYGNGRI